MSYRTAIRAVLFAALLAAPLVSACASAPAFLPEPRTLVIRSGARLTVGDVERMQTVYNEVDRQLRNIELDPGFLIGTRPDPRDVYPWETLEITADTAWVAYSRTHPDLTSPYQIYAHLHLMRRLGRLDEWLPEVAEAEGWPLEQAIMARVTDAWLLGRAFYDFAPYELMDEFIYASEAGWLDAFLLELRRNEFAEAHAAWLAANPQAQENFRTWYRETFDKTPPGV